MSRYTDESSSKNLLPQSEYASGPNTNADARGASINEVSTKLDGPTPTLLILLLRALSASNA